MSAHSVLQVKVVWVFHARPRNRKRGCLHHLRSPPEHTRGRKGTERCCQRNRFGPGRGHRSGRSRVLDGAQPDCTAGRNSLEPGSGHLHRRRCGFGRRQGRDRHRQQQQRMDGRSDWEWTVEPTPAPEAVNPIAPQTTSSAPPALSPAGTKSIFPIRRTYTPGLPTHRRRRRPAAVVH